MTNARDSCASRIVLIAFLMLSPHLANADKPRFGDTLTISIGGMNHNADGSVASTRPNLPLDRLTFAELDLDDDTDIIWADASWQFAERWQFRLSYSTFDTNGLALAVADGNFEGIDWTIGARLTSSLDVKLYIADVTWDFLKTEKGHMGVGIGVHAADLDFDLLVEVFASIGGGGFDFVPIGVEEASVLAPLPNVSLVGGYTFGDRVYVEGRAGWLSLTYDKYDGDLFSFRGAVEWRPRSRVGIGAGYQLVNIDVVVDRSAGREIFDFDFDGPIVFLSVGFP